MHKDWASIIGITGLIGIIASIPFMGILWMFGGDLRFAATTALVSMSAICLSVFML